jgi:putative selenate reductase
MILADFCNDCGNCDTFCPEHEGPYLQKPRFFFNQRNFHSSHGLYGFYFVTDTKLMGYLRDKKYILIKDDVKGQYKFASEDIEAFFDADDNLLAVEAIKALDDGLFIDMMPFSILKILFDSMKSAPEIYARTSLIGN